MSKEINIRSHFGGLKSHAEGSYNRDISFDEYFDLYMGEENDVSNEKYYPKDYEDRKKYILDFWWTDHLMEQRHKKINQIWENVDSLNGVGLELGFNWGGSTKWLLDRYENISIDGIDFSPYMCGNSQVFKEVYGDRVGDFWESSSSSINKPDEYYDFINSCSFFEHLPDCVYYDTLKECHRVLKKGGQIGVYLDKGDCKGKHLRMDKENITVEDMEDNGFIRITDYLFTKD